MIFKIKIQMTHSIVLELENKEERNATILTLKCEDSPQGGSFI